MLMPFRPMLAATLGLALGAMLAACASDAEDASYDNQTRSILGHPGWDDDPTTPPRPATPLPSREYDATPAEPPLDENGDDQQPTRYYVQLDACHPLHAPPPSP